MQELSEEYIISTMEEIGMYVEETIAVAEKAIEVGVARRKIGWRSSNKRSGNW